MTPDNRDQNWEPASSEDWQTGETPGAGGVRRPEELEKIYHDLLKELGEDPQREGLLKTPHRMGKAMLYLTSGYQKDINTIINDALFTAGAQEMVVVRNIEYYSMCEHHLIPFFGKAHVAYIPDGKVVGLSKIPRIVDVFARRLQLQEQMTDQIAKALMTHLSPKGVGVVTTGFHLCMAMRGVEKQSSSTVASAMYGAFREDARTRSEFLSLIAPEMGH